MISGMGRQAFLVFCFFLSCALLYGVLSRLNIEIVSKTRDKVKLNMPKLFEDYLANIPSNVSVVTVVIPLEEIKQRNRERAVEPLLKEDVSADDPRLVKAIRDHFIDPPSKLMPKMSRPLVRTPQAEAVEKILNGKVCMTYRY